MEKYLPSMCEAWGSIPSSTKNTINKQNKNKGSFHITVDRKIVLISF